MTILVPLLVALIGLITFALASGKVADIGRLMLACGLLVTLFQVASHGVNLLR